MNPELICRQTFVAAVEHHASIGSTNDRALALGREAQLVLPLLVVADQQTAGRGRGGHRWWTGPGSLAFSLLLDRAMCVAEPGRPPLVSLAAAVAVVEAVAPLLPSRPAIHWPNDVYVGDRKLAGILVEVLPNGRHVIGVGLNVNNRAADAPHELQAAVATLCDLTGGEHDRQAMLIAWLQQFARQLETLRADPRQIARRADALCSQHGQTLVLDYGDRPVRGRCLGIADDGALLLETADGPRAFCSGTLRRS